MAPPAPPATAGARRRRSGCLTVAGLGLLALPAACALGFVGLWRAAQIEPRYPPAQAVTLGPLTVLSGLRAGGPCAPFGVTADQWRCTDPSHKPGAGFPTSYRLWVIVVTPSNRLYSYQIIRFALPPSGPEPARQINSP